MTARLYPERNESGLQGRGGVDVRQVKEKPPA
jgi:hypothetical protein